MNTKRPWLQENGRPISDIKLKEISKCWDKNTWERYLDWYQSHRELDLTAVASFDSESTTTNQKMCQELLRSLKLIEAEILKLTYIAGLSEREVALTISRSQRRVQILKTRALCLVRERAQNAPVVSWPLVGGLDFEDTESADPSVWEQMLWKLFESDAVNGTPGLVSEPTQTTAKGESA